MSTSVYFQLVSLAVGNYLTAIDAEPFLFDWGPGNSEEGVGFGTLFTLLRYGPTSNYQLATVFGRVLGAGGTSFEKPGVYGDTLIGYNPNPFLGFAIAARSWRIMPNTVWIPGAADQHFYQLINVITQKALGADPQTGQVAFVEPNTVAAAFYIRQANLGAVYPNVVVDGYLPTGNSAGAILAGSNFGKYSGPFLTSINNSIVSTNQAPRLSPAVNGSDPVLNPSWTLVAENPHVAALTEDSGQNVLFVNSIP